MKKHNCLLLILVIACCAATRAQVEPKPAVQAEVQFPARTQAPPAQQSQPHHAARPPHRWSFYGSGGPAFPIGRFAQTDEDNPKSGPVHTGSLLELGSTYHLSNTWGITLLANQQHHNSEVDEIIVPGGPSIPELSVPGPLNGGPSAYSTPGPQHWSMTRILAGGVYTLPLNQKKNLALLVRALAGIQKTHTPQYEYFLTSQNITGFASFPSRNLAWAFSYQADAGLQWKVYRRWSLLAFAGYNGCRPSYNQDITALVQTAALTTLNASPDFKKIYFPAGSILFRAGVGFDL